MNELLSQISLCVEAGKMNASSPYPPQMKGELGADELTVMALESDITPTEILNDALVPAMNRVGHKFTENKIFVPQMLLSAKAMNASMNHLKPYFLSGAVKRKGIIAMGTVMGDLHDIGKNLCCMMIEGAGWEVIDLGVDVKPEQYIEVLKEHPSAVIGMSALLTTTMSNMGPMIARIRQEHPSIKIIVGGAPLTASFANEIGADVYGRDPQDNINWLESIIA